ncbi:Transmembrane protein 53 [Phlyctema vagabunda]|uniref:Transmembrane protein 53 n=1 Tax=Phlyctema vagabunda TaxID=108571 RepID=A0ABR4PED6_9HELO
MSSEESIKILPSAEPVPAKIALKPLDSFSRLSRYVSLYTPPTSAIQSVQTSSPLPPTTIVFGAWLNAHPRHIAKYTETYKTVYPNARIILITNVSNEFLFTRTLQRQKNVDAAVTTLLASPDERLLVHACSSGGAKRLFDVSARYAARTGKPLPAKALVFDSAPGYPHVVSGARALLVEGRKMNWLLWVPYAFLVITIQLIIVFILNCTPFWKGLALAPREGINDKRLLSKDCVRGYVYSEADDVVEYQDVEEHIAQAREKSLKVEVLKVVGAPHVKMYLGKGGEEAYWGFVKDIWAIGTKG